MRATAWIAVALAALAGGCGSSSSDDRFDLRTPGADDPPPRAEPEPEPEAAPEPPTRAEVAVIRGWSETLRAGHVKEAAAYFTPPVLVFDGVRTVQLPDRSAVLEFNRGLPCGAKLARTQRGTGPTVVATFRLTERPGPGSCGEGAGTDAAVAFVIRQRHIVHWERVEVPEERAPAPDDSRIS